MTHGQDGAQTSRALWLALLDEDGDAGLDAAARQVAHVVARRAVRGERDELDEVAPHVAVVAADDLPREAAEEGMRVVVGIPAGPGAGRIAVATARLAGAVACVPPRRVEAGE